MKRYVPLNALRWFTAACLAWSATSQAQQFIVFKVGGDADCTFTTIQEAVDASIAAGGENYIWIAENRTYANQHVVINNGDMIIEGGFPNCDAFDDGLDTTLISGTSGHSIFEIEGNSTVFLHNLQLTGATMDSSHKGGAIYFGGQGFLSLKNDWIHDNTVGYGGALAVNPTGQTNVSLESNLIIGPNTALVQGGAIHIEGHTTVTAGWNAGELPIFIGGNVAKGQGDLAAGGGIEVVGPASFSGAARIHNNMATFGAGIAVFGHDNDAAAVYLYTTDPNNAVQLDSNQASGDGGGVYLKSSGSGARALLCMENAQLSNNTAMEGAAIYEDVNNGFGAVAGMNNGFSCNIAPVGNLACAAGVVCNDISNNVSQNSGGTATAGATIRVNSDGSFSGQRFTAYGNVGGQLIDFLAETAASQQVQDIVDLHNCVLADNIESGDLINVHGGHSGSQLEVRNCTIADNQISGSRVINADVGFSTITDTIFAQPGILSLTQTHSATNAYILTNDTSTFASGPGIESGAPTFVDAANRDYHLQRTSLGVDFAPEMVDVIDLDGNPRSHDLLDIPNNFGDTDLGAYEIQTDLTPTTCVVSDTIFCNGFELPN